MVMGMLLGRFFCVCPYVPGSPVEQRSRPARPHPASRRFERVAGMIVRRIGVGKGALCAIASTALLAVATMNCATRMGHDTEIKTPRSDMVSSNLHVRRQSCDLGPMESIMDETTSVVAHAEFQKHYGSDPV